MNFARRASRGALSRRRRSLIALPWQVTLFLIAFAGIIIARSAQTCKFGRSFNKCLCYAACASSLALRTKMSLNTVRISGWMKNTWENHAKGKLKHTSFSQFARRVARLKPA